MFGGLCIIPGVLQLAYFPVFLSDFSLVFACFWVLVSGVKEK